MSPTRHRAKRWLALPLVVASLLAAAACSSPAPAGPDEPVSLRISTWGNDNRVRITQQAIDAFTAANPTIKVTLENSQWGAYWDKLATGMAANDTPDVIQMDESYFAAYGSRASLLDLTQVSGGLDLSTMEATALDTGKVEGEQVGVPVGLTNLAIAVNPSLLEKAGVAMPDDKTWTWDDYNTIAAQVTGKLGGEGVYGNGGMGLEAYSLGFWARQQGEEIFPTEGQKPLTEATVASHFDYVKKAVATKATPPVEVQVENIAGALDSSLMATNAAAFGTIWTTQVSAYGAASGSHLELLRLPAMEPGEPHMVNKASMYWSISSRTEHPEEAAKLIQFLLTDPAATDLLTTERGIPAIDEVRERVADKVDDQARVALEFSDAVAPELVSPPQVTPASASAFTGEYTLIATDVLFERTSSAEGATRVIQLLEGMADGA